MHSILNLGFILYTALNQNSHHDQAHYIECSVYGKSQSMLLALLSDWCKLCIIWSVSTWTFVCFSQKINLLIICVNALTTSAYQNARKNHSRH